MTHEPSVLCPLQDAPCIAGLSQCVAAALAKTQRPASPRLGVCRIAAAGRDGVNADVRAAAEGTGCGHASSLIDGERYSEVVDHLSGVQPGAHPDAILRCLRPVIVIQTPLDGDGAVNRRPGRGEGDHETVAHRLHLVTAVLSDLIAHEL